MDNNYCIIVLAVVGVFLCPGDAGKTTALPTLVHKTNKTLPSGTRSPSNDVNIFAKPTAIHDSYTKTLTVNCTFKHGPNSDFSTIMSLIVSKSSSPTTSDFREVASMTAFSGDNVDVGDVMGAQVQGHFMAGGQSYISLQWNYPRGQVEGIYKCAAFGMDKKGHPRQSSDVTTVKEKDVDLDLALTKLKNMDVVVDELLAFQQSVMSRVEGSRDAIMEMTSQYRGRNYTLSRPMNRNSATFDAVCKSYGGYLAEMNDVAEFIYVAKIIKDTRDLVAIGGTSLNNDHRLWATLHPAGDSLFLEWLAGQPTASSDRKCLYVSVQPPNAGMINDVCFDHTLVRFLCEI